MFLVLKAYMQLIRFEWHLLPGNFVALYNQVRNCPIRKMSVGTNFVPRVCAAVDMACVWYWKDVLCLQRSAATTCLLRRYGVPAWLVIGAQQLPLKAHAWVEVDGQVINDKPYTPDLYAVLDRC